MGFLIRDSARSVLAAIINNDLPIEKVHVESTIIFLRVPEKVEEALKFLSEELNGEVMSLRDALDEAKPETLL